MIKRHTSNTQLTADGPDVNTAYMQGQTDYLTGCVAAPLKHGIFDAARRTSYFRGWYHEHMDLRTITQGKV